MPGAALEGSQKFCRQPLVAKAYVEGGEKVCYYPLKEHVYWKNRKSCCSALGVPSALPLVPLQALVCRKQTLQCTSREEAEPQVCMGIPSSGPSALCVTSCPLSCASVCVILSVSPSERHHISCSYSDSPERCQYVSP